MSKEWMETLNLKTKLKISDKEYDFELYTIHQGIIQEIKFDNDIYTINTEEEKEDPESPVYPEIDQIVLNPTKKQKGKRGKYKKWSKTDEQYLIDHYKNTSNKEIADHLGLKNIDLIYYKAYRLGLRKKKLPLKTPEDPEKTTSTVRSKPREDDTEEFLQWLHNWENNNFTKGDVRRCTTLSHMRVDIMIEDQLIKGTIKRVSDFEFAAVKLVKNGELVLDGTG